MESTRRHMIESFNAWRLGISIETESVVKVLVVALLTVIFTLLQTTLFARFRPFGAIPDLLLPFVITVGTLERERFGGVTALVAAFFVEAAGGGAVHLLPLVYVPCAVAAGLLTTYSFRDSFPVAAMYIVAGDALHACATFASAMISQSSLTALSALLYIVLPEFFSTLLISALPCLITRALLRPFHKTRAERTGER